MFNKEQKESFIEEYLRSKVVAETSLYAIFRKTEPFERKLKKDASEFTKDEILNMFKEFKAKSVNSLLNYTIILKHYSRYIFGKVGTNDYELIVKADVYNLVDKDANVLLSRDDMDEIEAQLFNWVDKAIVELLWEGISGKNMEDICAISEECIKGDILFVNGKEFVMTDRLKELLPKAFAETEVMSYGKTMRICPVIGKGRIYKERANTRGIDSDDVRFRFIYRKIMIFREYLEIPGITMKTIQSSGLWHYLQIGMQETGLDLRSFLKTKPGEKLANRYGFGDYWVDNVWQKYEHLLK